MRGERRLLEVVLAIMEDRAGMANARVLPLPVSALRKRKIVGEIKRERQQSSRIRRERTAKESIVREQASKLTFLQRHVSFHFSCSSKWARIEPEWGMVL